MTLSIVCDSGETLFDETRTYTVWADWLGVPTFTLFVALGAVLERGLPFLEVFRLFKDDFDFDQETQRRAEEGVPHTFIDEDLYPDVRSTFDDLKRKGISVYVAGNMTVEGELAVERMNLGVTDVIGASHLGVYNDDPAFFHLLANRIGNRPEEIVYVTHRPDTALPAAHRAGLQVIFLRRGPIAYIRAPSSRLDLREIASLAELPEWIDRVLAGGQSSGPSTPLDPTK